MTADALRIGVVGVSGIGQGHLFAASMLPEYELAAVCDVVDAARDKAAADFEAAPFADAEHLFVSGAVDTVVIATPPFLHGHLVRAAIRAGLNVYCEKPLVPTAAEGYELGRQASEMGRVVQVGLQHRFQQSYVKARTLVEERAIGEVFRADLLATNWFRPQRYFDASPWRARWQTAGGGALISQAIHQVDAYISMVGLPVTVTARARRARHRVEVEDDLMALLEFESGARGTLVTSTVDPVGFDRITVHGEDASLVAEGFALRRAAFAGPAQRLSDESEGEFDQVAVAWEELHEPGGPSEWFDLLLDCHRDFVAAIVEGRPARNHPGEASRSLELINAAYLSAVTREPVLLPLAPGAYESVYEQLCSGDLALAVGAGS
jgi:predicted dehydrogenase